MNKAVVVVITLFAVLLIGVYAVNPYGVPISDPRSRILGFTTYRVASSSMAPTLMKGELILVDSATYASNTPAAGDIIAFLYPADRSIEYVHRVAATAGERLVIREGIVYINGKPLDEPYVDAAARSRDYSQTFDEVSVPEGHLFVLGDNRDNARDGRFWGFVPYDDVVGKVTYIGLSDDPERMGEVR